MATNPLLSIDHEKLAEAFVPVRQQIDAMRRAFSTPVELSSESREFIRSMNAAFADMHTRMRRSAQVINQR